MQREDLLPQSAVPSFISAICDGAFVVYEAYSEFETPTQAFRSEGELKSFLESGRRNGKVYFTLAVHYTATCGLVRTRRFDLDPSKCGGAMWRETTEGWGLVAIQLTFREDGTVKGHVSANSQKRALAWEDTMRERLGSVDAWDWPLVEKNVRRLIRKLRSAA
jgi:hypothetical protein